MKSVIQLLIAACLLYPGTSADGQTRDENWKADLAYLKQFAEDQHFNLYHTISRDEWTTECGRIANEIPDLTDLQIIGEFMKLLVRINDGHTLLYPPFDGEHAFHALPVEFYFFGQDLYIRAAAESHRPLVGKKIVAINETPFGEVIQRLTPYINRDNKFTVKWIMPIAMEFAEVYEIIGIADSSMSIRLSVRDESGEETVMDVMAGPLMWNPMERFGPDHWVDMRGDDDVLWIKDPENFYWFEYLADQRIVYFQFNQVRNKEDQPLSGFVDELMEFIYENPVDALIIDIRQNNGGNSFLNKSLIHALICNDKINQPGKLFTITGRRTFSAAMNLASDLEKHTNTMFVGEPTGSSPNFYGEDNTFRLPHSGLTGSISSRYWLGGETSADERKWIEPDIEAIMSADDYRMAIDPALESIMRFIEEN